jgi:uncharacterized membrane protein
MRVTGVLALIAAILSFLLFLITWVYWTFLIEQGDFDRGMMKIMRGVGFLEHLFLYAALILLAIGLMLSKQPGRSRSRYDEE